MMTLNGRACARGERPMSKDDVVQTSDLLRPRHVGMPIRRTEDPRLLTGNGEYTADRKPDRALHVAFRRSEQPHADIVRVDATKARAAPGVVAVFTADDVAAHVRVRDRFEMTRKAPLAIEPRSYCAEFESRRDSITLYTSSNIPGIVRDALAESLDLPGSRLRVVAPDVGGSFGSKGSLYPEEILLCVAAKKLRRSLKWTADRLDDISSSRQAFASIVDAAMGFDENGIAIALEADVI